MTRTIAGRSCARGFRSGSSTSSIWPSSVRCPLIFILVVLIKMFPKAITKNLVLITVSLPVYEAAKQPHTSLETSDYVLFVTGLVTVAVEFTADNQHQSFHKYKVTGEIDKNEWIGVNIQWTPEDAKRGFITKSLWAWSRHPNYACEQLFWVSTETASHVTLPLIRRI